MTSITHDEPLLDDGDVLTCDIEHPRLEGNLCVNDLDHTDPHEDADGNVWSGQDWINNR